MAPRALAFAEKTPDTLVIVTGDHAHTSQIIEAGTVTPGLTRTLNTKDGGLLTVNYGTSLEPGEEQH